MILNGGKKNHQFFITYDIPSIFGVMIKIKLTNGFHSVLHRSNKEIGHIVIVIKNDQKLFRHKKGLR